MKSQAILLLNVLTAIGLFLLFLLRSNNFYLFFKLGFSQSTFCVLGVGKWVQERIDDALEMEVEVVWEKVECWAALLPHD